MKILLKIQITFTTLFLIPLVLVQASNPGTTAGLTLLEPSGARPAALAEAFSAATDDITAFSYNPASLGSLTDSQASFSYQKGMMEDSYGQLMYGTGWGPRRKVGVSVGYYNGGTMELNDGTTVKNVTAQRDLTLAAGVSQHVGPMALGLTGKYINSNLAEQASASAMAVDMGIQYPFGKTLVFGAALQNLGTKMTYDQEGDPLPRLARVGAAATLFPLGHRTLFLFDAPYFLIEKTFEPAFGVETAFGPIALRAGYKTGNDLTGLTLGTGIMIGKASFDYAFIMVQDLESEHRLSLTMRFGEANVGEQKAPTAPAPKAPKEQNAPKAAAPEDASRTTVEFKAGEGAAVAGPTLGNMKSQSARRIYIVKEGDTLESIAQKIYNDKRQWRQILNANKHILGDKTDLEVGQRIILP